MMKKFSHKNIRRTSLVKIYMEPLSTPLIKIMNETKAEMDDVKIKVCRDPT